ncbi:hypothetical protein VTN96DRAFT_1177 [Rasamsonia emersonii]
MDVLHEIPWCAIYLETDNAIVGMQRFLASTHCPRFSGDLGAEGSSMRRQLSSSTQNQASCVVSRSEGSYGPGRSVPRVEEGAASVIALHAFPGIAALGGRLSRTPPCLPYLTTRPPPPPSPLLLPIVSAVCCAPSATTSPLLPSCVCRQTMVTSAGVSLSRLPASCSLVLSLLLRRCPLL